MDRIETEAQLTRVVRLGLIATAVTVLLMVAWSLFVGASLPPGAVVPIHWNVAGDADNFATKEIALALMPVMALVLSGLFALIPVLDPRRQHVAQSAAFLRTAWLSLLALLLTMHLATGLLYLGWPIHMDRVVITAVGCLFAVLGNMLGKVRSNFFMGVRTPWTLSSEYTWTKTNRATGWVMTVGGAAIALSGLLFSGAVALVTVTITVTAILAVALVYSYVIWRTAPDRNHSA